MSITDTEIAEIQSALGGMPGLKAWNAALGIGSNVTVEFGRTTPATKPHGEWHLWIQGCAWRLEARGMVVAGSDDPRRKLAKAVKHVEGLALVGVHLAPPAPDVVFEFEGNVLLKLFPFNFSAEYDDWSLFLPDGTVLIFGGEKPWRRVSATGVTEDKE